MSTELGFLTRVAAVVRGWVKRLRPKYGRQPTPADADLFPMPPFLAIGQMWPPRFEEDRLKELTANQQLVEGDHTEAYGNYLTRLTEQGETPQQFRVEAHLPQVLALLPADFLVGEPPKISAGEPGDLPFKERVKLFLARLTGQGAQVKEEQQAASSVALNDLCERSNLSQEAHASIMDQAAKGNGVLVASFDAGAKVATLQAWPPDQWLSWAPNGRPLADVIWSIEETDDTKFLNVEVHYRGYVRYRRYEMSGNQITAEVDPVLPPKAEADQDLRKKGIYESLVQPYVNWRLSNRTYGVPDLRGVDSIVPELDVIYSQRGMIMDKHAGPTMTGPMDALEPVTDDYGAPIPGKWRFKSPPDGKYIPRTSNEDPDVKYVVWDPQFDANFRAEERLIDIFCSVTGYSRQALNLPSTNGDGGAQSGTALRLRYPRTLQVIGRKRNAVDPALRRALYVAQLLEVKLGSAPYVPTYPRIDWQDGLPQDPKEQAEIEQIRLGGGGTRFSTVKKAIMRLDGASEAEAANEVAEIQAEEQAANPMLAPSTVDDDLNGPDGPAIAKRARELRDADPSLSEEQAIAKATQEIRRQGAA